MDYREQKILMTSNARNTDSPDRPQLALVSRENVSLFDLLFKSSTETAAHSIIERIQGGIFDVPINYSFGERAIDFIIDSISAPKYHARRRKITLAIKYLLSNYIYLEIEEDTADPQELTLLLEIIDHTYIEDLDDEIIALVQLIIVKNNNGYSDLGPVVMEALRHASRLDGSFPKILASNIVHEEELADDAVMILAQTNPKVLLRNNAALLNIYIFEHVLNDKYELTVLSSLFSELFTAANSQYKNGQYEEFLSLFLSFVDGWVNNSRSRDIRLAFMNGLSWSRTRSSVIGRIEDRFWSRHEREISTTNNNLTDSRIAAHNQLKKWIGITESETRNRHQGPITWNDLPFAEAGLIRLYQIASEFVLGIDVQLEVKTPFQEVGKSLVDKKITLAIHNDTLISSLSTRNQGRILKSSIPIFTFDNYLLQMNRDRLEQLVADQYSQRKELCRVANIILEEDSISSIVESDSRVNKLLLGEIVMLLKVAVDDGTDQSLALFKLLRSIGVEDALEMIVPRTADEGAAALVDGEVGFYIGGALQSDYMRRYFHDSISSVYSIEFPINEYLYIHKDTYEGEERFFDQLLYLWSLVPKLWRMVTGKYNSPRNIMDFINTLPEDILAQVNKRSRGFASRIASTDVLNDIYDKHDRYDKKWIDMIMGSYDPDSVTFVEPDRYKVYDNDISTESINYDSFVYDIKGSEYFYSLFPFGATHPEA